MTRNQIAYFEAKEKQRANLRSEEQRQQELAETSRSNLAKEKENYRSHVASETETNRSNLAREAEAYRTNRANEFLVGQRNAETQRSNLATEAINREKNAITASYNSSYLRELTRHNLVDEQRAADALRETERSNLMNERLTASRQTTDRYNAKTNRLNQESMTRQRSVENFLTNQKLKSEFKRTDLIEQQARGMKLENDFTEGTSWLRSLNAGFTFGGSLSNSSSAAQKNILHILGGMYNE